MKTVEYRKKSLHYRLATEYGNLDPWDNTSDICTYIKSLAFGFCLVCVIIVAGSMVMAAMLSPLPWILVLIITHTGIEPSDTVTIVLYLYFTSGCMGLLYWFWTLITNTSIKQVVSNSIVGHCYDSIHNKICFKITFK